MFDLKVSDLPELERLAKSGYGWIARDWNEQVYAYTAKPFKNTTTWVGGAKCEKIIGLGINSQIGVRWSDPEPLNIAAAIAQIEAQRSATEIPVGGKPLTWNERINQMTVEEKADWLLIEYPKLHKIAYDYAWKNRKTGKFCAYYIDRMGKLLTSPYKEATDD